MRKAATKALVALAWLLIWQIASIAVGNSLLLAGPVDTVVRLANDIVTATFWGSIAFSALRIVAGFVIAFALALVLGALSWRFGPVREFLEPAVSFIKSVPVVCIIVLLLMWMGSAWVSLVAVALMVFPPVYANFLEGLNQADRRMIQMLDAFQMGPWRRIRYYYLPLVLPFLASASRVVVGISWKAGIAAEVIGIPNGSIGAGIYLSKIGLDTAGLFAWTLVIVLISMACERIFLGLLEAIGSWSRHPGSAQRSAPRGNRKVTPAAAAGVDDGGPTGVSFEDVSFSYDGERFVLEDCSQAFSAGGRYCLTGPSGAGKSTLVALACGLLRPVSGNITVPRRSSVMFQDDRLLEQMSAWDNVRVTSLLSPSSLEALKRDLDEALGRDSSNLPVASCSGGMRRKVALFRALAAPGSALFLDEPFTGMDDASKADAIKAIDRYLHGRMLLTVTHDRDDAAALKAELKQIGGDERP